MAHEYDTPKHDIDAEVKGESCNLLCKPLGRKLGRQETYTIVTDLP